VSGALPSSPPPRACIIILFYASPYYIISSEGCRAGGLAVDAFTCWGSVSRGGGALDGYTLPLSSSSSSSFYRETRATLSKRLFHANVAIVCAPTFLELLGPPSRFLVGRARRFILIVLGDLLRPRSKRQATDLHIKNRNGPGPPGTYE